MISDQTLREVHAVSLDSKRRRYREQANDTREASKDLMYRAISAARITMSITSDEARLAYRIVDSLLEQDSVVYEQRLAALTD